MRTNAYLYLWLPLLAALFASGCGRIDSGGRIQAPKSMFDGRQAYSSAANESEQFPCGARSVSPDYDYARNGGGYYAVCPSRDSATDFRLSGMPVYDDVICAIPANAAGSSFTYVIPDHQRGHARIECVPYDADLGTLFSFEGATFNALFVIDGRDRDQMLNCLPRVDAQGNQVPGNYAYCPRYSFGRFRN